MLYEKCTPGKINLCPPLIACCLPFRVVSRLGLSAPLSLVRAWVRRMSRVRSLSAPPFPRRYVVIVLPTYPGATNPPVHRIIYFRPGLPPAEFDLFCPNRGPTPGSRRSEGGNRRNRSVAERYQLSSASSESSSDSGSPVQGVGRGIAPRNRVSRAREVSPLPPRPTTTWRPSLG